MVKMICRLLLWLTFLGVFHCYPQNYKLPELEVSSPQEVNSLERDEPVSRSINNNKKNTIDDTIQEVEEIIRANPALPRLTRGEILDLLENLTVADSQKTSTNRDPKAIMVVMPYTPTNDKNMEDLFTKAPVTQIIGAEPFKPKEETSSIKPKHSRRRPPVKFNDTDNDLAKKPLYNEERKKYSASIDEKSKPTPSRNQVRRRRPQLTTDKTTTSSTIYFKPTEPTTYHPKTRRPVRRRTTVHVSTTTAHPNHRYHEELTVNDGIRIIDSPKLITAASLEDLDPEENIKHEVVWKQEVPSFVTMKPNKLMRPTVSTTPKPLSEEINLPDNLKTVMKDLNLDSALNPHDDNAKISLEEQNRIRNMLASIGALPETTTTATTTGMPNAENVADSLSPDMRDLLMSFGLLPNPNEKPTTPDAGKYYPEAAEVKPESYIGFKPLPDDGPSRDDMEALLASFGLGRSARKGKALKADTDNKASLNFDVVPDHLKGIISDLGISHLGRQDRKIDTSVPDKTLEKQHIFNPDSQYATEDELKKLEKLIGMLKQIEKMNGTASLNDFKNFDLETLKELVDSLNGHNQSIVTLDQKDINAPDPNDFDSGVSKKEVKRQESTTAAASTSTTTEESETPSIKDLEDSFGGQPEETVTEAAPVETTTHIRTGFYYLVDWNTFLDIDDTKGKRVNLRFQPKVGDPKRFLSVSVP